MLCQLEFSSDTTIYKGYVVFRYDCIRWDMKNGWQFLLVYYFPKTRGWGTTDCTIKIQVNHKGFETTQTNSGEVELKCDSKNTLQWFA